MKQKKILFLYTSAGGGHVASAKALVEALKLRYPDAFEYEMADVLKDYAPKPLNRSPQAYSQALKAPQLYKQFYDLSDGQRRSRIWNGTISLIGRRIATAALTKFKPDIIVSVFHMGNPPVLAALERSGYPIPFINVVTDMVTIPPIWFDKRADAVVVPTAPAFQQGLLAGVPKEKMHQIGLPVSPRFIPAEDKAAVRKQLGWPVDRKIVLLMAGGAGVGPLGSLSKAIIEEHVDALPVIVAGNNKSLAKRLRSQSWAKHAKIYDFVDDMPAFMQAADILVSKAGPGTITEALNCHLPMILYSYVPGQEEGNAEYVTSSGAGYWAPKKSEFITTLRYLIEDDEALERARKATAALAHPKAADIIAQLIVTIAASHKPEITVTSP